MKQQSQFARITRHATGICLQDRQAGPEIKSQVKTLLIAQGSPGLLHQPIHPPRTGLPPAQPASGTRWLWPRAAAPAANPPARNPRIVYSVPRSARNSPPPSEPGSADRPRPGPVMNGNPRSRSEGRQSALRLVRLQRSDPIAGPPSLRVIRAKYPQPGGEHVTELAATAPAPGPDTLPGLQRR